MNIYILSNSKEQQGGVERFSFYVQQVLSEKKHIVTLLGKEDIVGIQRFIFRLSTYIGLSVPMLGYFLGKKAKQQHPDIVITNGALGWNIQNIPTINVQHGTFARAAMRIDKGTNMLKYFIKFHIWGFFEGCAARRATLCVAVSDETKESVEWFYHVRNVIVIPNAVDVDLFRPLDKKTVREKLHIPEQQLIAIFVGRFEYAKGKDILEGVQKYLETKGGRLIVAEKYSQEELADLYNASDVFLLPSLHEGCSYALLDAMSCGLPFLASPVGLVSDFKKSHMFSECVVEAQTTDAYIEKMEYLISRIKNSQNNGLASSLRTYIENNHNLSQFGFLYEKLIQEIQKK